MNSLELKSIVQLVVQDAAKLKDAHTAEKNAPVSYAAIFAQSKEEYEDLLSAADKLGKIIKQTPTGPLFQITPLETVSGKLQLLKIRLPDATRPERGDADFTVSNYEKFKSAVLSKVGFKLIKREDYEMIELIDKSFNVRAYFCNPPFDELLGLRSKI